MCVCVRAQIHTVRQMTGLATTQLKTCHQPNLCTPHCNLMCHSYQSMGFDWIYFFNIPISFKVFRHNEDQPQDLPRDVPLCYILSSWRQSHCVTHSCLYAWPSSFCFLHVEITACAILSEPKLPIPKNPRKSGTWTISLEGKQRVWLVHLNFCLAMVIITKSPVSQQCW